MLNVIDGDTVDCVIDLGFGLTARLRVRAVSAHAYIDTPERGDADWATARQFTTDWLTSAGRPLVVRTQKGTPSSTGIGDGGFGRWLGEFIAEDGRSLSDALVSQGWVRVR